MVSPAPPTSCATTLLAHANKKLQLMYYQYSVALHLYSMHPTKCFIIKLASHSLSIPFFYAAFNVARVGVCVIWALVAAIFGARVKAEGRL